MAPDSLCTFNNIASARQKPGIIPLTPCREMSHLYPSTEPAKCNSTRVWSRISTLFLLTSAGKALKF